MADLEHNFRSLSILIAENGCSLEMHEIYDIKDIKATNNQNDRKFKQQVIMESGYGHVLFVY